MALSVLEGRILGSRWTRSVAGGTNVELQTHEILRETLVFIGALTANITVVFPVGSESAGTTWRIENLTTGAFTLTVAGFTGSGVQVPQGRGSEVQWNGSQMYTPEDDSVRHDMVSLAFSNTTPHNLTRVQAKCGHIVLTGSPGGQGTIHVPASHGIYHFDNQSDQAFEIKTASGSGVVIATLRAASGRLVTEPTSGG